MLQPNDSGQTAARLLKVCVVIGVVAIAWVIRGCFVSGDWLVFVILFLPLSIVVTTLLVVAARILNPDAAGQASVETRVRRFGKLLDVVFAVGIGAILIEATVISMEAKQAQAAWLAGLSMALLAHRVLVRRFSIETRLTIEVGTILILAAAAMFCLPLLQLILQTFDTP